MIVLLLGCYVAAQKLTGAAFPTKIVVWTIGGMLIGVVINPYFPENIFFLYHHLVDKFRPDGYAV